MFVLDMLCQHGAVSPTAIPLATASLVDALYSSMRTRIVNGDIAQGEKVTENRIATEYDVARPTAKACLERLIVVGLLKRSAHKTAVVPILDSEDIEDLFFVRSLLESAAVTELAVKRIPLQEILRTQGAIESAAEAGNFQDQVAADVDFHALVVRQAGSHRLLRAHDLILGELQMTMGLQSAHKATSAGTIAAEHAGIIEAIEIGDSDLARRRMQMHLDGARLRILSSMRDAAQDSERKSD